MPIARVDEFIVKLIPLNDEEKIKSICNLELDYLRKTLSLKTVYSNQGLPVGVIGDARRLKTQVAKYRKVIKSLDTNKQNRYVITSNGEYHHHHLALKYFKLAIHEQADCSHRDSQRVSADRQDLKSFSAIDAIEKATELLESSSYVSKVAGLYLLTGRRHEEILITGKFENPNFEEEQSHLTDDWLEHEMDCGLFSGQIKLKNNLDIPYNIPLLAPLETIRTAIEWLRINKPHQPGQRPKGSKELGLKVRKQFQDTGIIPLPSGKDTYLNPHNLRSAYAAICYQLRKHSRISTTNPAMDEVTKVIMGHRDKGTDSAQNYRDYELSTVEVERLITKFYG